MIRLCFFNRRYRKSAGYQTSQNWWRNASKTIHKSLTAKNASPTKCRYFTILNYLISSNLFKLDNLFLPKTK